MASAKRFLDSDGAYRGASVKASKIVEGLIKYHVAEILNFQRLQRTSVAAVENNSTWNAGSG